ncbi:MAG: S1C family serine protease [Bacteriovoracia bacterium]
MFTPSTPAADLLTHADRVFKQLSPLVFKIKTAIDSDSPKAAYGSGFVVNKEGWLLTNYHVISSALQEPKKYKIYLVDSIESIPAEAVAVSVVHDLALVKVPRQFAQALRFATQPPTQGEKIYSIGIPKDLNLSIVEGTYNGTVNYGPYENIHMSSPINGGMSGGPTVNARGEIVGVNVAILIGSQNISFSVPARFGAELIRDARATQAVALTTEKLHQVIRGQLEGVQAQILKDLIRDDRKAPTLVNTLPGWQVPRMSNGYKCWSSNKDDERRRFESVSYACFLDQGAFLRDDVYSGSIEFVYETVKNRKLNPWQFANLMNDWYNGGSGSRNLYLSRSESSDFLTSYDCAERIVVNSQGMAFKFNYCLRAYLKYEGLLNAEYKFAALGTAKGSSLPNETLLGRTHVQGVTLANLKRIIAWQLDNIRRVDP